MKFCCHVEGNTLSRKELMTSCLTSNYIFPKGHISYKCHLRRQNNQDLLTLILFLYVHGKFPMDLGCVFHSTSNIYTSVFILDFNQTQISDFPSYIIKWSNAREELKGHKGKKKPRPNYNVQSKVWQLKNAIKIVLKLRESVDEATTFNILE